VRAAVEAFWNDLKRAHYIDTRTRVVVLTLGVNSNNVGVRSRVDIIFEFTSSQAVFSSWDVRTRVVRSDQIQSTRVLIWVAAAFTFYFAIMESTELSAGWSTTYFTDMWNVADWVNFLVFTFVLASTLSYVDLSDNPSCSAICSSIGYRDDWEVMKTARNLKTYLSLCVCLQLLKIIKFLGMLVPKLKLAPSVLRKALVDLALFSIVFVISMIAFSTMFFVQLGSVMEEYNDNFSSFVSLGRALFGDFDIDEIIANSSGFLNVTLFLTYLFVAVFIMLSMFFAILGESQANLREEQNTQALTQKPGEHVSEMGIFFELYQLWRRGMSHIPMVGKPIKERMAQEALEKLELEQGKRKKKPSSASDRIELRQLVLQDEMHVLIEAVTKKNADLEEKMEAHLLKLQRSVTHTLRPEFAERDEIRTASGGVPSKERPPGWRRAYQKVKRERVNVETTMTSSSTTVEEVEGVEPFFLQA